MLRSVINKSSWEFDVAEFSSRLSRLLALARPDVQLMDSSFYNFRIYQLGHVSVEVFAEIREQGKLTDKELRQLLESLQANILRFLVLYCVHGFRDQVLTKFSSSGEVVYKLKYRATENTVATATKSDEVLEECIPLDDDYIPCLKDLKNSHCNDGTSLRFQVAHLPIPQIVRLVLGEALYRPISTAFPAFLVHLEEYATILKTSQSSSVHERLFAKLRIRKKSVLSMHIIDSHIYQIFASIDDWWLNAKAQRLTMLLRRKLRQVKARNNEQQLWKSQDCEQGSPKLYYPLKRFAKYPHLLPNYLLPRISRRFNHFFMVYAVDALRESVQIKEKCGEIQFCLNRSALHKQSLAVNQRISQLYSSQDVEVQKTFSAEEPTCTSSSKQSPDRCMVSLAENRCRVMPSFHKLVVNEGFRDSRIPAAPKELPSATPADEDWELKFYERVKQDPAVPSYFKTTFGILVTNNRDLRSERAFLHSLLNRS